MLEQLYSIVDARYQACARSIATTNLMPDELAARWRAARSAHAGEERTLASPMTRLQQVGKRIVSRLIEMCGDPLPLFGEDKRRELRLPGASASGATSSRRSATSPRFVLRA